ncbi:MAG: hypothetical protein PGN23_05760 [Sphingomonas adhaesiva]|uniref:hypothetical protein n=1 Tax=Sphingomonas adhaesiva TaxID=28212 RepID=UPI002FF5D6F3
MVRPHPSPATSTYGSYVVRETRRGDVLGTSLKAAYDRDRPLPSDMAQMLALLAHVGR